MRRAYRLWLLIGVSLFTFPFWTLAQTVTPFPTPTPPPAPYILPTQTYPYAPLSEVELQAITSGAPITSFITPDMLTLGYQFEGQAGDIINIRLETSSLVPPCLALHDADGLGLAYGTQESWTGLNITSINFFRLPLSGVYAILVTPCGALGTITLTLESSFIEDIEYGQLIDYQFTGLERSKAYRFHGETGDWIAISMASGSFMPSISIVPDSSGGAPLQLIILSDSVYNPFWGPAAVLQSGDYLLMLRTDNIAGRLRFVLDNVEYVPLKYGETVEPEFTPATIGYFYQFAGLTNEMIQITVESADPLDTVANLVDPSGMPFAQNDDSGPGSNPEITAQQLYANGMYTLVLRPYTLGSSGKARLTLKRSEGLSLDDGPQDLSLTDKRAWATVNFSGVAGERVRLTITGATDLGSGPNLSIGQNGLMFVSGSFSGGDAMSFEYVVPADGTVLVQLSGNSGSFHLSLERLGTD